MRTRNERRFLTERYVTKQVKLFKQYHQHVWGTGYEITEHQKGRWRNHSCFDCGRSQCQMCMNPRRVKWNTLVERQTLQERRNNDSYTDQLIDYGINCNSCRWLQSEGMETLDRQ